MFTKNLTPSEIEYGLILIPADNRDEFPEPGMPVTLIDNNGIEFVFRMHNSASRIGRLTTMHQINHAHEGTTITVTPIVGLHSTYSVIYQ